MEYGCTTITNITDRESVTINQSFINGENYTAITINNRQHIYERQFEEPLKGRLLFLSYIQKFL